MKNINKKITELSPCLVDLCNQRYGKIETLEKEKDSLVNLANNRYDEIENLKEIVNQYASDPKRENLANEIIKLKTENLKLKSENKKLDHENINYRIRIDKTESEIKDLKTHLRLIAKLSDYESLGYKL